MSVDGEVTEAKIRSKKRVEAGDIIYVYIRIVIQHRTATLHPKPLAVQSTSQSIG